MGSQMKPARIHASTFNSSSSEGADVTTPALLERNSVATAEPRFGWKCHTIAVFVAAFAAGALFLREPGAGDDFTYWSLAFNLHDTGRGWSLHSFHDLRWPMWGAIWLWQGVFGAGLASYYGPAWLYL